MNKIRLVVFLASLLCLLTTASAGDFGHKLLGCPVPDCIGKWCCDDYCPKNAPGACVPLCFRCDDYCPKKVPCVCAPLRFGCDDYCKKRLPKVCSTPRCQSSLRCGPPARCSDCGGSNCNGHLASNAKAEATTPISAPERTAARAKQVEDRATEKPVRRSPVFGR